MKKITFSLALVFFAINIYSQSDHSTPKYKDDAQLFKVVEEMPRFPGCEDKGFSAEDLKQCSNNEMIRFIAEHLHYPKEAKKNSVEGKAIVQFAVNKQGQMEDLQVIRDPGSGCGNAAMAVIQKMKEEIIWIPGKQRGQKVRVLFTLPIDFKL